MQNDDSLEQVLVEIGYEELFLYGKRSKSYEIWQEGANQDKLETIVAAKESSKHGRFLAAEVLHYFDIKLAEIHYGQLAVAYANALANSSANKVEYNGINGNAWGLLYDENDAGYLGQQLILFGKHSIPSLVKLLGEDDREIFYEGSEEATIGNAKEYRIKDFAAYYLHKITNIPIQFHQEREKRDEEIEKFKANLENYLNGK